jgi:putative ABC transport system ATP-binding protein
MSENILTVQNIHKTFGTGHTAVHAVNDVSFSIQSGDIILIMGPSGSGKTTLLTIVGTLLTPDSGTIHLGDTEITALNSSQLSALRSREIGFIFQSFNLLRSLNTWENVAIVLEMAGTNGKEAQERAKEVLSQLGLQDRLEHNISDLSGGEQQRVSIARALVTDPKLILADEPTANLDSKSGHKVMELLTDIAKKQNRAVVIVSHDMRLMDIADRVLWLEDGQLKEGEEILVTDPVCEMQLQKSVAPFHIEKDDKTYYFCSQKCHDTFLKE